MQTKMNDEDYSSMGALKFNWFIEVLFLIQIVPSVSSGNYCIVVKLVTLKTVHLKKI